MEGTQILEILYYLKLNNQKIYIILLIPQKIYLNNCIT